MHLACLHGITLPGLSGNVSKYYLTVLRAAYRLFSLGLFLDPEDDINMFLRNVERSPNYTALQPVRPVLFITHEIVESHSESNTLLPSVDRYL
jgi:hypothetical protein